MKKADISEYFRKMGKKGGIARAKKLEPEQRQEIARNAGSHKGKKHAVETPEDSGEGTGPSAA